MRTLHGPLGPSTPFSTHYAAVHQHPPTKPARRKASSGPPLPQNSPAALALPEARSLGGVETRAGSSGLGTEPCS